MLSCPLGHRFDANKELVGYGQRKSDSELGKWVSIRTLRANDYYDGRLGNIHDQDFVRELYLVCPECGIIFRPKE